MMRVAPMLSLLLAGSALLAATGPGPAQAAPAPASAPPVLRRQTVAPLPGQPRSGAAGE